MKLLVSLAFSALVLAGCADAPATVDVRAAQAAGNTCRQLVPPGSEEQQVLCGSAEEWTEFDRRVALIDAGVTCRSAKATPALNATSRLAPPELCMTEERWAELDRRVLGYAAGQGRGEQEDNAAQIGFAMEQGAQFQAQFDASQAALMQMPAPGQ